MTEAPNWSRGLEYLKAEGLTAEQAKHVLDLLDGMLDTPAMKYLDPDLWRGVLGAIGVLKPN